MVLIIRSCLSGTDLLILEETFQCPYPEICMHFRMVYSQILLWSLGCQWDFWSCAHERHDLGLRATKIQPALPLFVVNDMEGSSTTSARCHGFTGSNDITCIIPGGIIAGIEHSAHTKMRWCQVSNQCVPPLMNANLWISSPMSWHEAKFNLELNSFSQCIEPMRNKKFQRTWLSIAKRFDKAFLRRKRWWWLNQLEKTWSC